MNRPLQLGRMSDDDGYGDDDFEEEVAGEELKDGEEVSLEQVTAEVEAHRAMAAMQQHEAAERGRAKHQYNKWGTSGPTFRPGKHKNVIDELCAEARTKPGPGHYQSASSLDPNKAVIFNSGLRGQQKIDDEEGTYIDPINSTTLTKQGTVISPSNNAKNFTAWDAEQVGKWLGRIGQGHLSKSFVRQKVLGKDLVDITPEELQIFLGVTVFADRRRLIKEISVLKGQLPQGYTLPNLGPGRYNSNTVGIYQVTKKRTDIAGVIPKGGPMPIFEDYVQREALEKPAPNTYKHVSERYQSFMSTRLGRAVKFSTGEPLTAVERRCRQIEDDPAPGDYAPRDPAPRHKGSTMPKTKRKDLWASSDVPGPGAYSGPGVQLHTISGRVGGARVVGKSHTKISPGDKLHTLTDETTLNTSEDFVSLSPDASQKLKKSKRQRRVMLPKSLSAELSTYTWPDVEPPEEFQL